MIQRYTMTGALALILLTVPLAASGQGDTGVKRLSSGEMAIEKKARDCYAHAVAYMGEGYYLLARQQFSEALALAMSQQLHDDARAGLDRVEKIIAQRR